METPDVSVVVVENPTGGEATWQGEIKALLTGIQADLMGMKAEFRAAMEQATQLTSNGLQAALTAQQTQMTTLSDQILAMSRLSAQEMPQAPVTPIAPEIVVVTEPTNAEPAPAPAPTPAPNRTEAARKRRYL